MMRFIFCLICASSISLFFNPAHAQVNTKAPPPQVTPGANSLIEKKPGQPGNVEANKEKKPVQVQKNLSFFNTVSISGVGNLYISQGDTAKFTVEADPKLMPLINVYVQDQILYLNLNNASENSEATINYYLTVKDLQKVLSYVSSSIVIKDEFKTNTFELDMLGGFGDATLNLSVNQFFAKIQGAGKITATGSAVDQNLTIQGVGEFHGKGLTGDTAEVNISGSGLAQLNVQKSIDVTLSGDAVVQYCGSPTLTKNISGNGRINPMSSSECK